MVSAPIISAMTALPGIPKVSMGMNEVRAGIVGGFGSGDTLHRAVAEFSRVSRGAFLERVGSKRAQGRASAGKHAENRAERRAAQHRRPGAAEVLARPPQPADLLRRQAPRLLRLRQIGDDLADAENADRKGGDVDAVVQLGNADPKPRP